MHCTLTLSLLVVLAALGAVDTARVIKLNAPPQGNQCVRAIDGSWQSFSIEYSYMADYFGNLSTPNSLSYNALKNLQDRSGHASIVRAGGSTANRVVYNASQTEQVILIFGSNPDQPSHVYISPSWYEAFQTAPEGVKFIYDVNYRDNSSAGVNATIADVSRTWHQLKDVFYAYELGNEMEGWGTNGRTPDWSPEIYVPEYLSYTRLIEKEVWGNKSSKIEPFFQGGTFQGSGGSYLSQPWNSINVLELGLDEDHEIKSMSQHDYHGNNCDGTKVIPELRLNLLNHTNVVNRVYPHWYMSPIVDKYAIEYVLGETNSIGCQGRDGVSNVFGAALWYLDYNLYVAANTSVAKMYFHQGTMYRYSLWAPFEGAANDSALIRPTYYSALMLADAIGHGAKRVQALVEEETLVVYSLYDDGKLDSLLAVNMDPYNVTANYTRPFVELNITASTQPRKVFKLTADGSDVKTGVKWAGQTVSDAGLVEGKKEYELYTAEDLVKLQSSEAILIKF